MSSLFGRVLARLRCGRVEPGLLKLRQCKKWWNANMTKIKEILGLLILR